MNCGRLAEKAVALLCCEKLHKIGKNQQKIFDRSPCRLLWQSFSSIILSSTRGAGWPPDARGEGDSEVRGGAGPPWWRRDQCPRPSGFHQKEAVLPQSRTSFNWFIEPPQRVPERPNDLIWDVNRPSNEKMDCSLVSPPQNPPFQQSLWLIDSLILSYFLVLLFCCFLLDMIFSTLSCF